MKRKDILITLSISLILFTSCNSNLQLKEIKTTTKITSEPTPEATPETVTETPPETTNYTVTPSETNIAEGYQEQVTSGSVYLPNDDMSLEINNITLKLGWLDEKIEIESLFGDIVNRKEAGNEDDPSDTTRQITIDYDDTRIVLITDEGTDYCLVSIKTFNKNIISSRGLKIGDSKETVCLLYPEINHKAIADVTSIKLTTKSEMQTMIIYFNNNIVEGISIYDEMRV